MIMYLCVRDIDFPLSTILIFDFGNCYDSVVLFCVSFHSLFSNIFQLLLQELHNYIYRLTFVNIISVCRGSIYQRGFSYY